MVYGKFVMNIGIIGAGYVGITTGICLADLGHRIYVYDIDEEKIKKLRIIIVALGLKKPRVLL